LEIVTLTKQLTVLGAVIEKSLHNNIDLFVTDQKVKPRNVSTNRKATGICMCVCVYVCICMYVCMYICMCM